MSGKSPFIESNHRQDFTRRNQKSAKVLFTDRQGDPFSITLRDLHTSLGIDLEGIAERTGLKANLKVANETGPYILHIGQTHSYPGEGIEIMIGPDAVIRSHTTIEAFLLGLKKAGIPLDHVFTEALTENVSLLPLLRDYKKLLDTDSKYSDQNPLALTNIYDAFQQFDELISNLSGPAGYLWDYIKSKKYQEFLAAHPSSVSADNDALKQAKYYTSAVPNILKQSLGAYSPYMFGADIKMYVLDRTIDGLEPARGGTSYEEGLKVVNQMEKTYKMLKEAATMGNQTSKLQRLKQLSYLLKLKLMKRRLDRIVDKGNPQTVRIIAENPNSQNTQLIPLIFGEGHDFTKAVRAHNHLHPDKSLGLIEMKPL